jgi:fumarate hydratase class II
MTANAGTVEAADAVLLALSATMAGRPDAIESAVAAVHEGLSSAVALSQAGQRAGTTIGGYLELCMNLLELLAEATGYQPGDLLRAALEM